MGAGGCGHVGQSNNKLSFSQVGIKINGINETVNNLNNTIISEINDIKTDINSIKLELCNANLNQMKSDIEYIKQKIEQLKCNDIKNEISSLSSMIYQMNSLMMQNMNLSNNIDLDVNYKDINNNLKCNKGNINLFNNDVNNKDKNIIMKYNNDNINLLNNNINNNLKNKNISVDNNNYNLKAINNNLNNFDNHNKNVNMPNVNINKKDKLKNTDRKVTISKDGKDYIIAINDKTTLNQFKNLAQQYFKIDDKVKIHYFNKFNVKKMIQNEKDFKNSLNQQVFKYYFEEEKPNFDFANVLFDNKNNNNLIQQNINSSKKINKNINNQNNKMLNNFKNFKNIKISQDNINNNKNVNLVKNNFLEENEDIEDIEEHEKNAADIISHLASCAFIQNEIKVEDYINSAANLSDLMKLININKKNNHPSIFYDHKIISKYPGLIANNALHEDYIFILSLIAKILEEKGINISIYKEKQGMDKLDGASLQYLFSGLTEKKKYEISFDLGPAKNGILLQKGEELDDFVDEWKQKISKQLNIEKDEVILVNPKNNNGLCSLDFVPNQINISYQKLNNFNEIKNIKEKSLIEECQLNTDIFDPEHNNQDGGWGIGEKRGGEDYIPPEGWFGYGLKVSKKYDNGDDTWLGYFNIEGEFAVAYFGLSNIYGNKKNLSHFLSEINSKEALNMGYEQIYKNDKDLRNPTKKCGSGIYLFQNPKFAENTAGVIDIGGVRYKLLLMCRVNPEKIRQPEGFDNCWILNCTPSEIRPYRILIKKIFKSPMAIASQNEIKTFINSPQYYMDIIKQKDCSFFNTNHSKYNNDDYVINLYTSNDYIYINNYLREGKVIEGKYNEKQIKSWVWCLHNSLTKKSNVSNSSTYYRGVSRKFPDNLGIGSKFIFGEFTSVSEDINVALSFASGGTLFIIRIENNNNPFYCNNITKLSEYTHEKEILITSNCTFQITKKENEEKDDEKHTVEKIYLTCEGYKIKGN